jgi:hypothetical protein
MQNRYRLFRRSNKVFYLQDSSTGKQLRVTCFTIEASSTAVVMRQITQEASQGLIGS